MEYTIIVITRMGLGTTSADDADFGVQMLDKFFHTLETLPVKPRAICLYTEGVKLAGQGSALGLQLRLLQGLGVRVLVCQTCLKHYGIDPESVVGEVGGMTDIVQLMSEADKVITV